MFCLVTDVATQQQFSTERLQCLSFLQGLSWIWENTAWKISAADKLLILKWFMFLHGLAFRVLVFCTWLKFILTTKDQPETQASPKCHLSPSFRRVFIIHSDLCWPRVWRETPSQVKKLMRGNVSRSNSLGGYTESGLPSLLTAWEEIFSYENRKSRWCSCKGLGKSFP